jgi:hypothetical protein
MGWAWGSQRSSSCSAGGELHLVFLPSPDLCPAFSVSGGSLFWHRDSCNSLHPATSRGCTTFYLSSMAILDEMAPQ